MDFFKRIGPWFAAAVISAFVSLVLMIVFSGWKTVRRMRSGWMVK